MGRNWIRDSDYPEVQRILDMLLPLAQRSTVRADGRPGAEWLAGMKLEMGISALTTIILPGYALHGRHVRLVLDALNYMYNNKLRDVEGFIAGLKEEWSHIERTYFMRPIASFQIILPVWLNFAGPARIRCVRILDQYFEFNRSKDFLPRLDMRSKVTLPSMDIAALESAETFIVANATGRVPIDAWSAVEVPLQTLRGLLEFAFTAPEHPLRLILSNSSPRNLPGPIRWFEHALLLPIQSTNSNEFSSFLFPIVGEQRMPDAKSPAIDRNGWLALRKYCQAFSTKAPDDSVLNLLRDGMRLWPQAIHSQLHYQAFIAYWQVAEALTLSRDVHGDTKEVARRLALLIGRQTPGVAANLDRFATLRNRIVHQGEIDRVHGTDVAGLRVFCHAAMRRMMDCSSRMPTRGHWSVYYERAGADDKRCRELLQRDVITERVTAFLSSNEWSR